MGVKMNEIYIKEQIRQQVKLSQVVEYLTGSKLSKGKMLCPFHREKTPSFFVNDTKGVFYCQGCGEGGDIFKFVMLKNNQSFKEAVRWVDETFHLGCISQKVSYRQFLEQQKREEKKRQRQEQEARDKVLYDEIALEYRICVSALRPGILEPFSDLWAYYIQRKQYLDYLIEEGGY